jgi:hypothetical protein
MLKGVAKDLLGSLEWHPGLMYQRPCHLALVMEAQLTALTLRTDRPVTSRCAPYHRTSARIEPSTIALTTATVRDWVPNFTNIFLTWDLTVSGAMLKACAIRLLE